MPYIPKQYDSAKDFISGYNNMGNIVDPMDGQRCSTYALYDDFYHNRPEAWRVTLRGDSDTEIYLPSTRKIIDATARFLAVNFDFTCKKGQLQFVDALLRDIFKREKVNGKFIGAKKSGLTRADAIWHITADSTKPKGKRISVYTVHPSCYFPIEDINDTTKILGVHLVDLVHDPRDTQRDPKKQVARRQTYRKESDGRISSEVRTFEIGAWDDRWLPEQQLKPVSIVMSKKLLPQQITTIPVYHIPNNPPDGSTWGMSQISGIEYIINALNQSITYEDLSLVLQGLGVYVSTAGPPVDKDTGQPGKYKLNPGNVVEISQGDTFERVTGVSSVSPFQDHMTFLDKFSSDGLGIPDIATGSVDVAVAQSGIALALKMGPIIAENQDKELGIGDIWDHIFYDFVHGWFPAFEDLDSPDTEVNSIFGDPMPINRDTFVQERINLYTANLLTADEVRQDLEKIGYKYTPNIAQKLMDEAQQKATAAVGDPYANMAAGQQDLIGALGNGNGSSISSGVG
jgi:hypothetical protein